MSGGLFLVSGAGIALFATMSHAGLWDVSVTSYNNFLFFFLHVSTLSHTFFLWIILQGG